MRLLIQTGVSKYLLPNSELKVEIPLNVNGSMKISTDEISLYAVEGKLNFAIQKHTDEVLLKIGDMASQIADYLPHTPVSAFGLNYIFEDDHNPEMDKLFQFTDSESIKDNGYNLEIASITRKLKKDNYVLTLVITRSEKNYSYNFNYNYNINSLTYFKTKFESKSLINYKNDSLKLLSELYKLELE
ncbi:MAG: hypothetical protein KKD86_13875 [Bacteroidetes bacterium]|nr:hypothetical protein [Bacteroidota bacterium]MBU1679917.1 hypothetical protein [Bacteroidota bacterium]